MFFLLIFFAIGDDIILRQRLQIRDTITPLRRQYATTLPQMATKDAAHIYRRHIDD